LAGSELWSAATCRRFPLSPVESGDKSPHSIGDTQLKTALIDYLAGGHPLDDFPTVTREQAIELLARLKETLKDAQI